MADSASILRKKARRGFKGYPIGTMAFYGPTEENATKAVVGIVIAENKDPVAIERWHVSDGDIRADLSVLDAILSFLSWRCVKSGIVPESIHGCPHEEGIDYATGQSCPQCPYWAGKERFRGVNIQ